MPFVKSSLDFAKVPYLALIFCNPSGTKEEHKPKLLIPDIFRWGRGLPCEGVGAKKFGMSLETREIKLNSIGGLVALKLRLIKC